MAPIASDVRVGLRESFGELFKVRQQHVPDSFLDELEDARLASKNAKMGEYVRVASIPVAVFEEMIGKGYPVWRMPAKEIIRYLRKMGYEKLFATSKNVVVEHK